MAAEWRLALGVFALYEKKGAKPTRVGSGRETAREDKSKKRKYAVSSSATKDYPVEKPRGRCDDGTF